MQNKHGGPNLNEFYEYFKLLNTSGHEAADISDFQFSNNNNNNNNNGILNSKITREEISRCIDRLNNGKSAGLDNILNEHIKSTINLLLGTYEKLFNIILDSGCFPQQWSTGMITPKFKNKGDRLNPPQQAPDVCLTSDIGYILVATSYNQFPTSMRRHFLTSFGRLDWTLF